MIHLAVEAAPSGGSLAGAAYAPPMLLAHFIRDAYPQGTS
jgi:hypothetical protein